MCRPIEGHRDAAAIGVHDSGVRATLTISLTGVARLSAALDRRRASVGLGIARMGDGSIDACRLIGSRTGNALVRLARGAAEADVLASNLRAIGTSCAREAGIDGRAAGGQVASRCRCCLAVGVREARNTGLGIRLTSRLARGIRAISGTETLDTGVVRGTDGFQCRAMVVADTLDTHV